MCNKMFHNIQNRLLYAEVVFISVALGNAVMCDLHCLGVVAQTEGMIYVLGRPKVIPSYKGDRFLLAP